jgi:nanoRNase/pAp phosphatase (c-di-AMP/oligoRNAs hydrolase)
MKNKMEKKKLGLKLLELDNPKDYFSISTYTKIMTHSSKLNKVNLNENNNNNENDNKKNLITVDNNNLNQKYNISEKKKKELRACLDPNNILNNAHYFNENFKKDFLKRRRETTKTQSTQVIKEENNNIKDDNNDLKNANNE